MDSLTILIIDKSGSMNEPASNDPECIGFTRMNFAQQGAITCVLGCLDNMNMAIISFDSQAAIISPVVQINEITKQQLISKITYLYPSGGTNIMSAMNLVKQIIIETLLKPDNIINIFKVIILTDGEDMQLQEYNVDLQFEQLKINNEFKFQLDTIGFGPDANTKLLVRMSQLGSGTYALCFDASMVGTIFSRTIVRTYIGGDAYGIFEFEPCSELDQSYKDKYNYFRLEMIELLSSKTNDLVLLQYLLTNLNIKFREYLLINNNINFWSNLIRDLQSDLNDQISKAISSLEFWNKWGQAYWITLAIALDKQYCPNFKDKCLQCFGSNYARQEYDRVSDIYDSMPMIKPSGSIAMRISAVPSTSQSFNNRDSGCFHPGSLVQLFDNGTLTTIPYITLESLMRESFMGESLYLAGPNGPVKVECIIKTMNTNAFLPLQFSHIGNCVLTRNHPIMFNGRWTHPGTISEPIMYEGIDFVFNLILAINPETGTRYSSVLIDNQICICLGHGILDDPVATDHFWGSERIVDEMKRLYPLDYLTGVIEFRRDYLRNTETGWIDQII